MSEPIKEASRSGSAVERLVSELKSHMANGYQLCNRGKGWWLTKNEPYVRHKSYGPYKDSQIEKLEK